MKIISFNINGLRAHLHQIKAIIVKHNPDIIALQEIKVQNDHFPFYEINKLGYHAFCHGQKAYYGVAFLSKEKPFLIKKDFSFDKENGQCRLITLTTYICQKIFIIINAYFPQGENRSNEKKFFLKKIFYKKLYDYVVSLQKTDIQLLIVGDMNVSHTDLDIGIGKINQNRWIKKGKCSFLPEEREWLTKLLNGCNLIDIYRVKNPNVNDSFSWFDYRSKAFQRNCGLRIDLILSSKNLIKYCIEVGIDYEIRNIDRPSDHAPIWVEFDFSK
ncbi:exodeoxyribonuclease III [Candidatus Providencia siddallii]|uniref:Exodeoxyribonuclease III n=1 Tax=Candidatus Providencia siddallii TaxID=1715285 RepID=A0ABM9NNZ6_9GAMM